MHKCCRHIADEHGTRGAACYAMQLVAGLCLTSRQGLQAEGHLQRGGRIDPVDQHQNFGTLFLATVGGMNAAVATLFVDKLRTTR